MDLSGQQLLGAMVGEGRGEELANFGNKVKEYWNTVKTEPQVRGRGEQAARWEALNRMQ